MRPARRQGAGEQLQEPPRRLGRGLVGSLCAGGLPESPPAPLQQLLVLGVVEGSRELHQAQHEFCSTPVRGIQEFQED